MKKYWVVKQEIKYKSLPQGVGNVNLLMENELSGKRKHLSSYSKVATTLVRFLKLPLGQIYCEYPLSTGRTRKKNSLTFCFFK